MARIRKRALVPKWGTDRHDVRLLLVDSDGASAWAQRLTLERELGAEVVHCSGPTASPQVFPFRECRLIDGDGRCALVEGADVVIFNLALHEEKARTLLQAYRSRFPETPVCVQIPEPDRALRRAALAGCEIIRSPTTGVTLVNAVRRALGRRRRITALQ